MTEKKPYREFTEEFKLEGLELFKKCGKTAAQIERDLGISPGLLLKWRDCTTSNRMTGKLVYFNTRSCSG